jgi:hypothetical protein
MTARSKDNQIEAGKLVLLSPGGHKYELSVSDSGNVVVTYKTEEDTPPPKE